MHGENSAESTAAATAAATQRDRIAGVQLRLVLSRGDRLAFDIIFFLFLIAFIELFLVFPNTFAVTTELTTIFLVCEYFRCQLENYQVARGA